MSDFADIFSDAAEAVDEEFSELVRIMPRLGTGGQSDPDREPVEIQAPLRVGDVSAEQLGSTRNWAGRIQSGKARLTITRATYEGPDLAQGDLIRALHRPDQPDWEIQTINERHKTRIICELGEV